MLTIQQIKKQVDEQKKKTQALAKLKAPVGQTNVEARAERLSLPKPVLVPKVTKPTWTEAKVPVTAESQQRDLALAKRVVSTTPGALAYGVARGISAPVTATAKLMGYQESPEEAAVRTLAESKRLTSQMDVSKGMGAPQIIQGRSVAPEMIGRVAGSILPFSVAESAVGRVLPSLAGQGIAKTSARGALAGGTLQGLEEAGQGKRGSELAKSVAIGTALGAGADIGLGYLAKAIRSIKSGSTIDDVLRNVDDLEGIKTELELPPNATADDVKREVTRYTTNIGTKRVTEGLKAPAYVPKSGTLKIANVELDKAYQNWNDAMERIQNYFGTSELRQSEIDRIKPELGIDLDELVRDMDIAERSGGQTRFKQALSDVEITPEKARLAQAAGIELPRLKRSPLQPRITQRQPIAPELTKSAPQGDITPMVAQRMEQEVPDIGIAPKETPKVQKVSATLPEGQQQSKLYSNTLPKSDIFTPQELENLNIEYEGGYTPKANAETLANAKQRIADNGADAELEKLKGKDSFNSDDFVTSMEILKDKVLAEARATGDYSKVPKMLELIRKSGSTEAGRVVQAHQIYTRTPEGMITVAKKVVDNVNAKGGKATLTPDDIQQIDKSMRKFQELPPGREKDVELAKVKKIIADKIPPTFIDKFRGLQRISWLLNPKTLITRNPLGNILLQGAEGLKNIPATGLDYLIGLKTGKRTTTMAGGYGKGLVKGAKDQIADIKQGVDTSPTGGQAEITKSRTFENETLNKLDQTVSGLLKLGDRPFYEGAFNSRINQLKKLNKTEDITPAMEEDAKLYALERTLQKDSEIAKVFAKLKNLSDNPAYQVFANTLLPFTKTPANILDKMFEYSPGGFVKAFGNAGKAKLGKGTFDQKYFVDNLSRALTGTGIIALGYAGAKNGVITGKPDKDKEVAAVERLVGRLPYAFNVDGGSYTFDWAQPVSALLAIGADAYYGGTEKDTFAEQLQGMAEAAGNTFLNMSMLQGITKAFSGYSPVSGLMKATTEGVTGIASPTIGGQLTRIIDPTVRETQSKLIPKMIAKTPGLSKTLPPKLDLFGRETQQAEGRGVVSRIFENMLSPGYYASGKTSTPALKEAYRVYKATGEKDIFPRLAPDTVSVNKETKRLTPELKAEYQKQMGKMNLEDLDRLINTYSYKNASDDDKAKMLNDVIKDNREETKKRLLPEIKKLP